MSIPCRFLLLCTPALALSCAGRPELARARPEAPGPQRVAARWTITDSEFAALRPGKPAVESAYAPMRAPQADTYVWHNRERVRCPPEPSAPKADARVKSVAAQNLLGTLPERTSAGEPFAEPAPSATSPERVIARLRPALHHCFARWIDDQADAQGSVRLALELGCAGEVESISAQSKGVDESALACLFSAVAPARFAVPPSGHAAFSVPIVFKNLAR